MPYTFKKFYKIHFIWHSLSESIFKCPSKHQKKKKKKQTKTWNPSIPILQQFPNRTTTG